MTPPLFPSPAVDLIWMGREVVHLRRFRDNLQAARRLLGRDDHLANLLLEDSLAELQIVLGEQAERVAPRSGGRRDRHSLRR